MSATKSERIRLAYNACARLVENDREASHWFQRAFEEAAAGERQHRNSTGERYRMSALDAARYFAVKWFLAPHEKPPASYATACALRPDALYGYGARDRAFELGRESSWLVLGHDYADVVELDYVEHIAPIR